MGTNDGQSPGNSAAAASTRVLIVDDEETLLRGYARILKAAGLQVEMAGDGQAAIEAMDKHRFDVIVSDISMPRMDGMEMLREIRERDLDVPVILVTGNPTVASAQEAVAYGAMRYLVKPVDAPVLVETVNGAAKLHRIARLKREAMALLGAGDKQLGDRAGLEAAFDRALDTLWMAYQPIVGRDRRVIAYEALVRVREATLPHPGALFSAAEELDRLPELGRAIRAHVATTLAEHAPDADIFINLHPRDLTDETLYSPTSPLARYAKRIVLEITERSSIADGAGVPDRIKRLRDLGYRIAIDDLGAGYAGLNYFTLLTPDVVKLDISLIRDIHTQAAKQKLVGSMAALCHELGMLVVAEGVESTEEGDMVSTLGCDLLQGYLFARPGPPFPAVAE